MPNEAAVLDAASAAMAGNDMYETARGASRNMRRSPQLVREMARWAADPSNPLNRVISAAERAKYDASIGKKLAQAQRAVGPALSKIGGVGEIYGTYQGLRDIAQNGANTLNVTDTSSNAALALRGLSLAAKVGGRLNPVTGAAALGWQTGRLIGDNLPEGVNDKIGGTINQALQSMSGGRLGVDDSAYLEQQALSQQMANWRR